MALERIGRPKISLSQKERELAGVINNLVESCEYMSKQKIGALIVLENTVPLKEYIDTGTLLNAKISKDLILSIFMNRSPLHDGAIIIKDDILVAASCILPHSSKTSQIGWQTVSQTGSQTSSHTLGTRHKAAIGLSESTDAKIIVISEEKGTISFAQNGDLDQGIALNRLQLLLNDFFKPPRSNKKKKS